MAKKPVVKEERILTDGEKNKIIEIQNIGKMFVDHLNNLGDSELIVDAVDEINGAVDKAVQHVKSGE